MRIVFMGTPEFSVPSLEALIQAGHEIAAVVAQPDRPRGRGLAPASPPTARAARRSGIPVLQPARVRAPAFFDALTALAPELIVVVAFGQILPKAILDLPPRGCINLHASLLPRYRGAAPIQWAILRGERVTGLTTMTMNEEMDAGDILRVREVPIREGETAGALAERLCRAGAPLLVETVQAIGEGRATPRPQDPAAVTMAPRLRKEDGRIPWADAARDIVNRVRAVTPWPGAFTTHRGRTLKVWEADLGEPGAGGGAPAGSVLRADASGIAV
ncbi:MAG: methionyl-tRNA formyltransferase, partial [Myxococcota bacterium]